jgi:uncharacterized membrane protein YheB (UPF0754 family)
MEFDWLVLLIPAISAFIGWGTNVVAVQMMFYPVDFFGIRPFLGWQGIVPANARKLAHRSTELITSQLIDLRALFADFDASGFSANLEDAIDELTDQVIAETAAKYAKAMWDGMDETARAQVRQLVRAEVSKVTVEILAEMGEKIEDILDLTDIVVDTVERDKALVGEMFQQVGDEEFRFIKRSGAYFGLLFGVVQMFAWLAYPAWWVLPAFGFFVGYATNWLALKLIFEPAQPTRIGPFTVQGLFHKRQHQVAAEYAKMVSRDILNPDNMVRRMVTGPAGEALFGIIDSRLDGLIDRYKGNPMAAALVPAGEWDAIRADLKQRVRDELPRPGGFLHVFTSKAIDVHKELLDRMVELDSESFEGVLRPPFQEDEWKLIIAGAALGTGAGVLQVLYLFGDKI